MKSTLVRSFDEARAAFQDEPRLALDLETSGFSPWDARIHVIALYGALSDTVAVLHYPKGVPVPLEVLRWLEGFSELVMHNGVMFDALFLATHGMAWDRTKIYDTMIAEQSIRATNRKDVKINLAATAKRHTGKVIDKTIEHGHWGNEALDENQMEYVLGDITHMLKIRDKQLREAAETGTVRTIELELEAARANIRMMLNGIPVDVAAMREYFESRAARHEEVTALLQAKLATPEAPILLSSPVQLKRALGELFGPKAFPDTKAERLMGYTRLGGELGETSGLLLEWRHYVQRKNAFGETWIRENVTKHGDGIDRVHGKFWQLGTETGRFSSSKPNLQQLPSDMKQCFGNVPGMAFGHSDYAAIEVRVAAALAPDERMIEAFNNGEDIHRVVASAGFGQPPAAISKDERQIAKAMSFTLLFGGGIETFRAYAANNGADISQAEAEAAVENFYSRFSGIHNMRKKAEYMATNRRQVTITYPTGLRRQIQGADLKASTLLNNAVQGYAAAGIKYALVELERAGLSKYLIAVVHDEMAYWAPLDDIETVRDGVDRCMLRGMELALQKCPPIALEVESTWGTNWIGDDENEKKTILTPSIEKVSA